MPKSAFFLTFSYSGSFFVDNLYFALIVLLLYVKKNGTSFFVTDFCQS